MGRAASRYVTSPTSERRSADTSPTLLRSGASRPFITGTYNGCVYYPLRAAGPKTRDRAPSLCPRSTLNSFLSRIRIPMASATPRRNVLATMWRGVGQSGLGPTIFSSLRVEHAHSGRPPLPGKPSGTLNPRCPACPKEARLVNQRGILTRECESSEQENPSSLWGWAVGLLDFSDPKAGRKIRDKLDAICSELTDHAPIPGTDFIWVPSQYLRPSSVIVTLNSAKKKNASSALSFPE